MYHDEGNINISFISPVRESDPQYNLAVIKEAAGNYGLELLETERHDLRLKDKKVTGSAFYLYKQKKLHHCTLLLNADEENLWNVLKFGGVEISSKSIQSIRSPVANLMKENKELTIDSMIKSITKAYQKKINTETFEFLNFDHKNKDWENIEAIAESFRKSKWLYGETPEFVYRSKNNKEYLVKNGLYNNSYFSENMILELEHSKVCNTLKGGIEVSIENYNPATDEMIQVMDKNGHIIHPELMPEISNDKIVQMYKTMVKSRVTDIKTLQFQRQGRILTYAPNLGQEAAQVGTIAASEKSDWVASAFRELGAWLYREAPLYNILLYWYGNEDGMNMPEHVKILPVSIPIASQLQHATGLAYASVYKGEKDVVLGYVGDGGTSQGDFHEALNFAGVMNVPCVFIVQNNQFAISTRRNIQTKAKTIAQKALAYGIPGYQVDGNDIFAVYAVTKLAVDRARNGQGSTLIEAYTYRLGAHTTADDPTVYRDDIEVEAWKEKDPIDRLRKYLINQGLWSDSEDNKLKEQYEEEVKSTFEKVEKSGPVSLEEVFDYTYAKKTQNLDRQYNELKKKSRGGEIICWF